MFKGLSFAIPHNNIKYSDYLLPFELLFRDVNSLTFSYFDKEYVKIRLRDCAYSSIKQVSKISDKNLPNEKIKVLTTLIKIKNLVIQSADKGKTIETYRILHDTLKFKRLYLEEGQVLNQIIHMEQCIIDLLKN